MAARYRSAGVEHIAPRGSLLQGNEQEFGQDCSTQLERLFTDNVYLAEPWHTDEFLSAIESKEYQATWRLKDRMKTAGVALVVCLNLGTDPPDVIKPVPCARKECWIDPVGGSKQKNLDSIGHELQHQYEKLQSKAKYKQCLDPTSEDLRRVCINLRKAARNDRLLLHYNGHGVPLPTKNGELWVFGKHYTHYMPVAIFELRAWLGEPAIYVLDCSRAGTLLPHFVDPQQLNASFKFSNEIQTGSFSSNSGASYGSAYGKDGGVSPGRQSTKRNTSSNNLANLEQSAAYAASVADKKHTAISEFYNGMEGPTIVLAACRANEILPLNPLYPADVFTSCLTTPLTIALRWFILENPYSMGDVSPDLSEHIPGKDNDRKTPRGELNWIFTAITDTIAWTTLPSTTFQKMFRQDLLVASLFRNFLLAKRIMKGLNCSPQSWPPLPDSSSHPLWHAWDLATEACLSHVVYMQKGTMMLDPKNNIALAPSSVPASTTADAKDTESGIVVSQSAFFTDNLTAFEIWLDFGGGRNNQEIPMHLPILLQVLLSQTHRLHALLLLRRYLSLGPEAVNLALLVGIFPYILKLLQSPAVEIRQVLVCIWASVLGFDPTCRVELVRDKSQGYFIQYLAGKEHPPAQRCMAAFVLAELCSHYRDGQSTCLQLGLHRTCASILSQPEVMEYPLLKRWTCLCLFKYCEDFGWSKYVCLTENGHVHLYPLLEDPDPTVRAAAILALGEIFGASNPGCIADGITAGFNAGSKDVGGPVQQQQLREQEQELAMQILESCSDGSVVVRKESLIALGKFFQLPVHASSLRHVASELIKHPPGNPKMAWILTAEQTRSLTDSLVRHLNQADVFGENLSGSIRSSSSSFVKRAPVSPRTAVRQDSPATSESPPSLLKGGIPPSLRSTRSAESSNADTDTGELPMNAESAANATEAAAVIPPNPPKSEKQMPLAALSVPEDDDEGSDQFEPQQSRNALMAAAYVSLWLALFEIQGKDPHHEVRRVASALIQWVRNTIKTGTPSSASLQLTSGFYQEAATNLMGFDEARAESLGDTSMESKSADGFRPQGAVTPNRMTRSGNLQMPLTLSPLGIAGARSPASSYGLRKGAFPYGSDATGETGMNAGGALMFPLMPMEESTLSSHLYSSFRTMFLTPDEGYDAKEDSLSERGCEKLYREERLKDVLVIERRLKKILQDNSIDVNNGVSSPIPSMNITENINSRELLYDAPVLQFDDNRGAGAGLEKQKAVKAIKFEQRAILNIDNAEHLTSHVMFHPFLDILAVSDGKSVGIWNLANGSRIMQIKRPCDPNYLLNPENKNTQGGKERKKKERTGSFSLMGGSGSASNIATPSSSAKLSSELHGSSVVSPDQVESSDTRITAMTWINESFDALLALGADNGAVSIWRDTSTTKSQPQSGASTIRTGEKEAKANAGNESTSLASAFNALPDIAETTRGSGVVFSWQQHSGTMVVGGNSSTIRLWDLGREQCVRVFPTGLETCTTTLASKTVAPLGTPSTATSNPHSLGDAYNLSWTFAGFADGSIAVYDERVQGTGRVASAREHSAWIVAAHFRPDVPEVITGSVRGSVKFWDLRTMRSFKTLEVHKSPLTALAVHPCAPIMATGSHAQFIKILTLGGEQLGSIIKYHDGFLGQRIGPVSCLAFHPTKILLAAGATDSIVSIYGEKKSE